MILSKRPEIERFLDRPPAAVRAALIHGRDRSGVRERADRLAGQVTAHPDDPFDTALLSDTEVALDPARMADQLSALSLMGGRRLVRLRLTGEKAPVDRAVAEALKQHADGDFNPDAFFLVEAGGLDKSSPLRKAAEAHAAAASLAIYEDETEDVAGLLRESLSRERLRLTPEAQQLFVSRLPKDRGVARQEIERLILYLGPGSGAVADAGEIEPFLGVDGDVSLADAAAHAFGGKAALVQDCLRRARAEGEGGPAVVRAASQHLGKLRRAGIAVAAGTPPATAAKSAGVFWKAEREFLRHLAAWRAPQLEPVQADVLEADRACKQTGSPDALIAERLMLSIAGRARRLGL